MLIEVNDLLKFLNENIPGLHFVSGNSNNADSNTYYVSIHEFNDSGLDCYIVFNKYNMTTFFNDKDLINNALQNYSRKCGVKVINSNQNFEEKASFIHYVSYITTK